MKRLPILLLTPLLLLSVIAYATHRGDDATHEVEEIVLENPKPQIIIHSVANILAQIGSIIGNPHNKPNVGQNVAGILGNIVNIALIASKRGFTTEQEIMDYLVNELHLDQEIRRIIEHEAEEVRRTILLEA